MNLANDRSPEVFRLAPEVLSTCIVDNPRGYLVALVSAAPPAAWAGCGRARARPWPGRTPARRVSPTGRGPNRLRNVAEHGRPSRRLSRVTQVYGLYGLRRRKVTFSDHWSEVCGCARSRCLRRAWKCAALPFDGAPTSPGIYISNEPVRDRGGRPDRLLEARPPNC